MTSINWKLIDDHEFVHLTADLLRGLGFVEVQIQGDGPDGGLDLIASELVSFAIPGAQPFRWGFQCKFSKTGIKRSVNDSEIKDVEGILRSDRYAVHDLRGYTLITNRRIVQNIIERLSGINRRSSFRTAYLDGAQLNHRLSEFPDILEKYFGEVKESIVSLGPPVVIGSLSSESLYLFDVELSAPFSDKPAAKTKVCIDSGADMSGIPITVLHEIKARVIDKLQVVDSTGIHTTLDSYEINLRLGEADFKLVRVLGLPIKYGFIGQDLLRQTITLLDGPNGLVKLWPQKK